jgi:succinate dehydrogenase/fumarate reductase flavoprotein subunit
MTSENSGLTRRKFIVMGSAAIATPLLMNTAGAAAAEKKVEKKPEKKETYDIKKKMEYDLVIIGGGLAGLVAAARAAELGIKKIGLFEKGKFLGGNGLLCNTFVSSDFADFGDYNTDSNQIGLYRRAMNTLKQTANPELVQRYLFATKRITKWLEDRKINEKWKSTPSGHPEFESTVSRNVESSVEGARLGAIICKALMEEIKTRPSVESHLNSPAVKLLTDSKGDVRGAVIKLDGGDYAEVTGKKLILACGGVGGTNEALAKWLPKYHAPGDYMNFGGVKTCSGDGIDMAEDIGAEVGKDMNIHMLGPSYAGGRGAGIGRLADDARVMVLSKKGERIVDETYLRDAAQPVCNRSPGKVLYIFMGANSIKTILASSGSSGGPGGGQGGQGPDAKGVQGGQAGQSGSQGKDAAQGMPQGQGGAQGMPQGQDSHGGPGGMGSVIAVEDIPAKYADDIKKGALCIAKDLNEAAKFIGCDVKTLKASLDRYEESCKKGYDSQLLKTKENLLSPGGPPYYILWSVRSMDSTQGGITTNKDFEAVTPDGKAIKGMYITGDHATGFVTSDYYGPGGAGFTFAMVSGFLTAEDTAKYIKGI